MKAFLISICFLFSVSAYADVEDDWRNYDNLAKQFELTAEEIADLKQFDLMAFGSPSDSFVSLSGKGLGGDNVKNVYAGLAKRDGSFWQFNDGSWRTVTYAGLVGVANKLDDADILILGVQEVSPNSLKKQSTALSAFLGKPASGDVFKKLTLIDHNKCGIFRETTASAISKKTLIVVPVTDDPDGLSSEEKLSAVSCINRGHYYHFGFSNALNLPASYFAMFRSDIQHYIYVPDKKPIFPFFLSDGQFAGASRIEVLRAIVQNWRQGR